MSGACEVSVPEDKDDKSKSGLILLIRLQSTSLEFQSAVSCTLSANSFENLL